MELLGTITDILALWHVREFRRLRDSLIVAFVVAILLLPATLFISDWQTKLGVLIVLILCSVICSLSLAYYRSILAIEIGMVIKRQKLHLVLAASAGAEDYIRLVAAILASEIAAGLIALWLPAYKNRLMAIIILLTAMIFVTHRIWQKGKLWWPKLVHRLAIFTLLAALATIFFGTTADELSNRLELDKLMAGEVIKILPTGKEKDAEKVKQAAMTTQTARPTVIHWGGAGLVKAPPDRWSEPYTTPSGPFKIVPARGQKAEILFSNGKYYLLDSFDQIDIGNTSGSFRLRGVGKEVTVFLYKREVS